MNRSQDHAGLLGTMRESAGFTQRQTRNTFPQFNPCFIPPLRVCGFDFYYSGSKRQYPLKNRVEFQGWLIPEIKPANPQTRILASRKPLTSRNAGSYLASGPRVKAASNPGRNPQPRQAPHG